MRPLHIYDMVCPICKEDYKYSELDVKARYAFGVGVLSYLICPFCRTEIPIDNT
jgi:uncharacterized protein YbaR (Trm112 family)